MHRHRVKPFTEYKDAGSRRFMLIFSLFRDAQKIANPNACLKIFILFLMTEIPEGISGGRANRRRNCHNALFSSCLVIARGLLTDDAQPQKFNADRWISCLLC
jgi:hypothetical protein